MGYYRKKPIIIEAIQWLGINLDEFKKFIGDTYYFSTYEKLYIRTPSGDREISIGDYIIREIDGGFRVYTCFAFEDSYDLIPPVVDPEFSAGDYNSNTRPYRGDK